MSFAATLELVDEQGIGAASMRAVSSRLGVRSMSLYRYVRDRDELLDAVVERIVNELADDPEVQLRPVDGWRPYLSGMAHGVRRYALAHPRAFPLVATRPPAAPWVIPPIRSLRWVETMQAFVVGGVTHLVECGPVTVLAGLARRITTEVEILPCNDADAMATAIAATAS